MRRGVAERGGSLLERRRLERHWANGTLLPFWAPFDGWLKGTENGNVKPQNTHMTMKALILPSAVAPARDRYGSIVKITEHTHDLQY
jgi:hypothetical protein